MVYLKALEFKESSPACTNIPPICPVGLSEQRQTFWKYNFIQNMVEKHPTDDGLLTPWPTELIVREHIYKAEEQWMGVARVRKLNEHIDDHNIEHLGFR